MTHEKIISLKKDLSELIKKYGITLHESDNYDNDENYTGSTYYLNIDGETYYTESLNEIFETIIAKLKPSK